MSPALNSGSSAERPRTLVRTRCDDTSTTIPVVLRNTLGSPLTPEEQLDRFPQRMGFLRGPLRVIGRSVDECPELPPTSRKSKPVTVIARYGG